MKQITLITLVILTFLFSFTSLAQENKEKCTITNTKFSPGEEYLYVIAYNWFVVFSEVGQVSLKLKSDEIFGQPAYHYIAEGRSFNWWDKFFKVRDKYEAWVRQDNLRPIYFQRNTREGNWRQHESYMYENDSVIYRKSKVKEDPVRYDTIPINGCTWDVLSALLYTRNFDFSKYKSGDRIPISVALDHEVYDLYFRYQGIEDFKLKGVGTFECMKFTVMLVEGTMFHEGENMVMWVTNDKNQIPLYIESPILIGSIKARLVALKGNRYPITSKKK